MSGGMASFQLERDLYTPSEMIKTDYGRRWTPPAPPWNLPIAVAALAVFLPRWVGARRC